MAALKPQWCDRHWLRMRDDVSYNSVLAGILLMQRILEDPVFIARCGGDANADVMNSVNQSLCPLCCHLGDDIMEEIYAEALKAGPHGSFDA